MNFDVMPDAPYAALNQFAADGTEVGPPEAQHVELEEGLLPHRADGRRARPPDSRGGDVRDQTAATCSRASCRSPTITSPSWVTGSSTAVTPTTRPRSIPSRSSPSPHRGRRHRGPRLFNPYYVTPAVLARSVGSRARRGPEPVHRPAVQTFPSYLVSDVVRLLQQTKTHLGGGVLLDSEHESPPTWRCVRAARDLGPPLARRGHFALRLGVHLKLSAIAAPGASPSRRRSASTTWRRIRRFACARCRGTG